MKSNNIKMFVLIVKCNIYSFKLSLKEKIV